MNNCDAQVEVRPGFPDEIWSTLRPKFEAAKWLLPHWVNKVGFEYRAKQEYICEIVVYREYREVWINVSDDWLTQTEEARQHIIVHEIVHCLTVPLKSILSHLLEDLRIDEGVTRVINRQINNTMETVTEDFAIAISKKMSSLDKGK